MGLSRMVDHIKPLLRPKSDQPFSHSLGTKRTLLKQHVQTKVKYVSPDLPYIKSG